MVTPPERIVTLLPSATEIVCGLGLGEKLVGVTHECDYPPGVEQLPHVTRSTIDHSAPSHVIDAAVRLHLETTSALYTLNEPLLKTLAPDLLVTQALCDVCAVSEADVLGVISRLPGPPGLVNLEPMTLSEVFDTITMLGTSTGNEDRARQYRNGLQSRVDLVRTKSEDISESDRPSVGFLEWIDPPFNAGHWTPEIIEYAGGIDSFGNKHQPSQTISFDTIAAADPDVLVIALCGFDEHRANDEVSILRENLDYENLKAVKNNRVYLIDGNSYFSRPGPRLVDSLEILFGLLHPNL
jgi:iron complex transport system substrate-binding protein